MKKRKAPKAVLFDMDGVLIDSMPMHVAAWSRIYKEYGIDLTEEYLYSEEGRVATKAIEKLFKEQKGIELSEEETLKIHSQKADHIKSQARPPRMDGMLEFVQLVRETSATSVVTGSGQATLINTLNDYYPACFDETKMVSARDVKYGKPHPEPYLMGLKKHGIKAGEAIVVENAPLGTLAGNAAGIFVLAINSGKLTNNILYENGADVVLNSVNELVDWWKINIK